jgi:hypothetical protein
MQLLFFAAFLSGRQVDVTPTLERRHGRYPTSHYVETNNY